MDSLLSAKYNIATGQIPEGDASHYRPQTDTQAVPRYLVEVLGAENLVFPLGAVHVHEEAETELQV